MDEDPLADIFQKESNFTKDQIKKLRIIKKNSVYFKHDDIIARFGGSCTSF